MSMMFKYRVHEVAKDFKVPTKTISKILTDYATAPKNHMQVLTTDELDLIFEHMTQHNQIESIEEIYAVESPAAEPHAAKNVSDTKVSNKNPEAAPKKPVSDKNISGDKPAAPGQSPAGTPAAKTPDKPYTKPPERKKRVVDTSGATINIAKYDDRLDKLVPERAEHVKTGKQKFSKKKQTRGQSMASGAKRRQEERDRMQRLQFEVAKKAPVKSIYPGRDKRRRACLTHEENGRRSCQAAHQAWCYGLSLRRNRL